MNNKLIQRYGTTIWTGICLISLTKINNKLPSFGQLTASSRGYKCQTSGYAMVVHGRPINPKNTSLWGVTQLPVS